MAGGPQSKMRQSESGAGQNSLIISAVTKPTPPFQPSGGYRQTTMSDWIRGAKGYVIKDKMNLQLAAAGDGHGQQLLMQ